LASFCAGAAASVLRSSGCWDFLKIAFLRG
jgi:hypothetical protein